MTHLAAPEALRETARAPSAPTHPASAVAVHSAAFADDVGCRVTKDDERKAFVFSKRD